MSSIGWQEIVIVLFIALLVFGPRKLPEMGRSLGKGIREFRKASREIQDDNDTETKKIDSKTPEQKG